MTLLQSLGCGRKVRLGGKGGGVRCWGQEPQGVVHFGGVGDTECAPEYSQNFQRARWIRNVTLARFGAQAKGMDRKQREGSNSSSYHLDNLVSIR